MQQEEVLAPLDDDERDALKARLAKRAAMRNGTGAYATARPGSYVVGYTTGYSARGSVTRGHPTTSPGYLSPARERLMAQTARREAEVRTARDRESRARDRARRAAQHAAALTAARQAAEDERREQARQALAAQREWQLERGRLAKESARKAGVPSLGTTIARAMPIPLTEKQKLRKIRQARPEWGSGHAGGLKMLTDPSEVKDRPLADVKPDRPRVTRFVV